MKKLLLALLGSAALVACDRDAPPPPETPTQNGATENTETAAIAAETERLNAWFAEKWEEQLDFSPMTKTTLGRKDDYDKIDDSSEAGEDKQLEWRRIAVAEMKSQFDRDLLTPEAKISYDIFIYELERAEAVLPYRRNGYVFTQMQGVHTFLPNFLINFHKVETEADMTAYIARIGGVSRAMDQLVERARLGAEIGVRPPRFAFEDVIKQAEALVSGAPFDGEGDAPLWADAQAKIAALVEADAIDDARAAELRAGAEQALLASFGPSYDNLLDWLREDMVSAAEVATGVWNLPEGRNYYATQLAQSTTTDLTPDEVHQIGLDEVARIRSEMEAIKEQVGFDGTLQEFFTFVREDEQFYYPNTDEGREAYLQAARDHLGFINEKLPDYFGLLPKADLVVKRVEAFREQDGAAQHYYPGTPDGSRPGIFYAHLSDMGSMPIPQLEVIAYHEANPGHHMQISIAQELEGVPEFRTQSFFGAYIEGWALYSELLAREMGAYEDPYSDFGRLTTEIWRAIRLVLDTGLHDKEWTEEVAVAYFMANSPAAEGQIRSEVKRYIVWPGQATSYKIGMLKILELRAKAKEELGADFDIGAFHDTVLGGGALPLSILERRVDDWIAGQKST